LETNRPIPCYPALCARRGRFRMRLVDIAISLALLLPASSLRSSEYPFFAMDTGTRDGKHKTPESQVKMLKELGYAGVGHTGFGNIPEMLKHLDANGLKMFTVYVGVSLDEGTVAGLEQGVKALEGRDTLIWLTVKSRKFAPSSIEGDKRAVEVIGKIADVAAKAKLRVALYPHAKMFVERVEDAVRIAKKCGRENVGATFNLCHWLNEAREANLVPVLRQAIPYLYVVSINGAESGGKGWEQLIQPLDRGSFNNARLLATLKHLDYKGPVGLQGYGIGGDVHTNLTRSMKAWRAIQEKVAKGEVKPFTENEAFAQLGTYRQGKSRAAFSAVYNRFTTATPDARAQLESMLIDLLKDPNVTMDSKREGCRVLKLWGTTKSVPALAKLLPNAKLAHMVLDALHAKPYPEVDEALREALPQVPDDLKPGVIATIGARGDRQAVSALAQMSAEPNLPIAHAALKALGDIGGTQAAKALAKVKTPQLEELKALAQLKCAESMLAEGEKAAAADVFKELLKAEYAAPIRIAALAGISRADEQHATPLVLAKLKDQDVHLRSTAISLATEMTGPKMTKALAAELTSADTGTKIALLAALAKRGDKMAVPAVVRIAASGDEPVQIAAFEALCVLGDATHVKQLAETAGAGGNTGEAAASALNRLKAEGVDKAILECLKGADPKTRVVLVKSMGVRHTPNAVPPLMKLAKDADTEVRREALRALGLLSGPDDLPHLVKHLTGSADPQDRTAAADMVLKVAKAINDKERRRKDLVAALPGSEPALRVHLINILGRLGELEIVKDALNDKSAEVQDAAVRTLAAWPDATPMATLQELAIKASREVHRVLAFRGYVRLLGLPSTRTPVEDLNLYRAALEHAHRPEEQKLILNALGNVTDLGVLALIEKYMEKEDTKAEAVTAYLKAAKLVGTMSPGSVRKRLEGMASAKGPGAKKVQEVLNWIKQCDGYITTWLVAGPYTHEGGSLFDQPFPPEQPGAQDVAWRLTSGVNGPFTKHITPGAINLGAIIGGNNRTAYLRTGVYCPEKRKALLQLGSDDSVKVWLNGKSVHAKNAKRAVKRAEDVVQVELKEGWNILLMKIVQGNGEWGACARFANLDGSLMEGLLVRPQQQAMK